MTNDFDYESANVRLRPVDPTGVRTNMTYDSTPQHPEADRPVIVQETDKPKAQARPTPI